MSFRVLSIILACIYFVVAGSYHHATLPTKAYWNCVFPNTPIPKALQDLLQSGTNKDNFASMVKDIQEHIERSPTNFLYGFGYKTVYFLKNDLHYTKQMAIPQLSEEQDKASFLPRGIADSMPFSMDKFAEIMKLFSMGPNSLESEIIKVAIKDCEAAAAAGGEDEFCATSLESLIDLSVSKLGKNIQVFSTEFGKETETQDFTLGEGVKTMGGKLVVCHKEKYPYAVFLCHSVDETDAYVVPLVGADGTRANAVVICHRDTSAWNPEHRAFKQLNVKLGTVPICHFLTRNAFVWVPNS